jgi:poly(A) polymerase
LKLSIEPGVLSLLSRVGEVFEKKKVKAYLVGGLVRDALLGRETADIDIAVVADALKIAPEVADTIGGRCVLLDEENGVARVVLAEETGAGRQYNVDISTIAGSIEDDLARRDFTVDAIAVSLEQMLADPADVELIDPCHGQSDLNSRIIRAVSAKAFEADAVRLLRAVRLAGELDFGIDDETEMQIHRYSPLITGVAGERVREELLRILALPGAGYLVRYLDRLGLLIALIPELLPARGVEQPKEHVWDVYEHSLETVNAVAFILREGKWEHAGEGLLDVVPWSERLERHFREEVSNGSTRSSLMKLAALLHDIAKPQSKAIQPDGRMRFLGHADEGARIAAEIMERLRFSKREIRLVEVMVKYHLRPVQMSNDGVPTGRAIYRYFRDTGEAGIDTIFLSLADHLAARGPTLDKKEWENHAREMEYVLHQKFQTEGKVSSPRLVDGHEIMVVFGLKPGPAVGKILEEVKEAQAAGELSTKQQALAYIREHLLYEKV